MDKYDDECQHGKIQAQKNQWNRRLSVLSFIQFVLQKWNGSLFSCWVIFQYFGCLEQVKNNNLIIFILRDFRSAYCLELVLTLSHFINWRIFTNLNLPSALRSYAVLHRSSGCLRQPEHAHHVRHVRGADLQDDRLQQGPLPKGDHPVSWSSWWKVGQFSGWTSEGTSLEILTELPTAGSVPRSHMMEA